MVSRPILQIDFFFFDLVGDEFWNLSSSLTSMFDQIFIKLLFLQHYLLLTLALFQVVVTLR